MIIDTIVMKIPYDKATIVDYSRFDNEEAVNDICRSYISKNGSARMLFNNPTKEDLQNGYFPRITLYKSLNVIDESFVNFKIECSLQKILFGNNVYEYSESDFGVMLWILHDKLCTMGLFIDIEVLRYAFVSRVDYSKNILIPNSCWSFIRWINKADLDSRLGKADRDYQNGGTAFKSYSKQHHILIYDKIAEVEKSLYCENRSVSKDDKCQGKLNKKLKDKNKKILRFEVSFLKRNKLNKLCKSLNLEIGKGRLCNLFKDKIAKTILQHYSSQIFSSLKKLNLDSIDEVSIIERIQKAFPNATSGKISRLFAQNILYTKYGADFIRNIFKYKPTELCKIRKELEAVNSAENSSFSSIMQNIHAVEDCLEEFLPIEEDFLFNE